MTADEAAVATLEAWGLLSATPNTASVPIDPGAPDTLYVPADPPSGGGIVAAGLVEYAVGEVTLAVPQAEFPLPRDTIVLDAKVFVVLAFDAGTSNGIILSVGSSVIFGGGFKVTFANAYDVNNGSSYGGAPVTGVLNYAPGADTPQFLPVRMGDDNAVYADYSQTGTAATQGDALVVLTLTRPF